MSINLKCIHVHILTHIHALTRACICVIVEKVAYSGKKLMKWWVGIIYSPWDKDLEEGFNPPSPPSPLPQLSTPLFSANVLQCLHGIYLL